MNLIILRSTVKKLIRLKVPMDEIQVGNNFNYNNVDFVITYVTRKANSVDFGCAHIVNKAVVIED